MEGPSEISADRAGKTGGRIIAVVGMHRSGTSALARGVQALGVPLGDNLMAAISGENEKGFFEDMDIHRFAERLMVKIGTAWHKLTPLDAASLSGPLYSEDRRDAGAMLASKVANCFAFKNPRTAVLLPFWRCVFDDLDLDDRYVVAVRNPLECAVSLQARNGFHLAHGLALWTKHFIDLVNNTQDRPRVFVSYERLLSDPLRELHRISTALDLTAPDAASDSIAGYCNDFLTPSLRRNRISRNELARTGLASPFVQELYDLVFEASLSDQRIDPDRWSGILERYKETTPLLAYADALYTERVAAQGESTENAKRTRVADDKLRDAQDAGSKAKQEITQLAAELDGQRRRGQALVSELENVVAQLKSAKSANELLAAKAAESQGETDRLKSELARETEARAGLTRDHARDVAARSAREEALKAQLSKSSHDLQTVKAGADKRERELAWLQERNAALSRQYKDCRRDLLLARAAVTAMRRSTSWRLTGPIRAIGAARNAIVAGVRSALERPSASPERDLVLAMPAVRSWRAAYQRWATAAKSRISASASPQSAVSSAPGAKPAAVRSALSISAILINPADPRDLERRLREISNQSLAPSEIIFIDDAFHDDSIAALVGRILAEASIDWRIVRNPHNAQSAESPLRTGAEIARGEFVWIADARDRTDSRFLETAAKAFQSGDVVLSVTQSRRPSEAGNVLAGSHAEGVSGGALSERSAFIGDGRTEVREALAVQNTIPTMSAVLFRRTALAEALVTHAREIGAYRVAADWCVYVNVLRQGDVAFSPEVLTHRPAVTVERFDLADLAEVARMQAYVAREFSLPPEYASKARAYLENLVQQFGLDRRWPRAQIEGAMRGVIAA